MKKLVSLFASALLLISSSANAGLFNFTGHIEYHNDVVYTYFTLDTDATDVRVWTDSFQDYTNFDPITALWNADTGAMIDENDDDDSINPATQTNFDSGFTLANLAAGNYLFTVATYNNFALGSNLSDGFTFDGQTPIDVADWDQPANSNNQRGKYWSVWMDGVDSATGPVPVSEPASLAILIIAFAGMAASRRKSRK